MKIKLKISREQADTLCSMLLLKSEYRQQASRPDKLLSCTIAELYLRVHARMFVAFANVQVSVTLKYSEAYALSIALPSIFLSDAYYISVRETVLSQIEPKLL